MVFTTDFSCLGVTTPNRFLDVLTFGDDMRPPHSSFCRYMLGCPSAIAFLMADGGMGVCQNKGGSLFLGVVTADASRFLSGFVPAGEVAVHDVVEGRAVVGHKQVGEFVYDDVLYAPVGQEQQIDGD